MEVLTVRVPESIRERLDELASKKPLKRSKIIREAIDEKLKREERKVLKK